MRLKILILRAYYGIYDYGVNTDEIWMNRDWSYLKKYSVFNNLGTATERCPIENIPRWIITQSKGFARKCIEKVSKSVRAFVYLVLTSQIQARSSIVGKSTSVVDAQQAFNSKFTAFISEDLLVLILIGTRASWRMHH